MSRAELGISASGAPRPSPRSVMLARRAALLALSVAACATTPAPARRRADAALTITCAVADARVYVDDQFAGRAAELADRALVVTSGTRRVEVRADGYFTVYRDVPVTSGARARLTVELRRVPDLEPGG
jgi:hypothetical protein